MKTNNSAALARQIFYRRSPGLKPIGGKITISRIGRGDCPARQTRGIQPQYFAEAFSLAEPKTAVAICARVPLATELYRPGRLVAPLNVRSGFSALACRDSRRYRLGRS